MTRLTSFHVMLAPHLVVLSLTLESICERRISKGTFDVCLDGLVAAILLSEAITSLMSAARVVLAETLHGYSLIHSMSNSLTILR